MIRKVEIERFSVRSSKSFETVVAALKAGVGRLDLVAFAKTSKSTSSFSELENLIGRDLGSTGLMLFTELDHGAVLRKETGLDKPKIVRFMIGNPLIMKEMAKHVPHQFVRIQEYPQDSHPALMVAACFEKCGYARSDGSHI